MAKKNVGKTVKIVKKTTSKPAASTKQPAPKTATKTIKIHHHHAKPYRKRHYGALIVLVGLTVILATIIFYSYNSQVNSTNSAKEYLKQLFSNTPKNQSSISSTFGFSVLYSPNQYYATAIDSANNNLYIGDELDTNRAYQTIRISSASASAKTGKSSLTLDYQQDANLNQSLETIQDSLVGTQNTSQSSLVLQTTTSTTVGGKKFLKSSWKRVYGDGQLSEKITPRYTTYVGTVNSKPFTILLSHGFADEPKGYEDIINSITFGPAKVTGTAGSHQDSQYNERSRTLFDSLSFTNIAQAQSSIAKSSEYISSLYGPTVVRIYNVYCRDIQIDSRPYLRDACNGVVGSGFFVSSDGYIATNGHVAGSSIKDTVIEDAISTYSRGNSQYLDSLIELAGIKESDIAGLKTQKEIAAIILDKLYELPDSHFTETRSVSNLLVTLGEKQPDAKELIDLTNHRREYGEQDQIKRAKLSAIDFRLMDGANGFRASDVAIVKVSGSNYPVAKLGIIDDARQGAALSILGFPATANANGLVDSTHSKVTLTSGKVSSLKNTEGNSKKLIETDTVIGHGNSGGPAFSENGGVVGIATYTIDAVGTGNGVFNYIRDIADLKDLAAKSSISFNTTSKTQAEWQKGIDQFYKAHYSKAIQSFDKVKALYPAHPTAASLGDVAKNKIKAGEEVKDFPVVMALAVALAFTVAGAGVTVFVIISHKKKHGVYQQNVNAGNITPIVPGTPPQYVAYASPPQPDVEQQAVISAQRTVGQQPGQPQQAPLPQMQPLPQQSVLIQPMQQPISQPMPQPQPQQPSPQQVAPTPKNPQ